MPSSKIIRKEKEIVTQSYFGCVVEEHKAMNLFSLMHSPSRRPLGESRDLQFPSCPERHKHVGKLKDPRVARRSPDLARPFLSRRPLLEAGDEPVSGAARGQADRQVGFDLRLYNIGSTSYLNRSTVRLDWSSAFLGEDASDCAQVDFLVKSHPRFQASAYKLSDLTAKGQTEAVLNVDANSDFVFQVYTIHTVHTYNVPKLTPSALLTFFVLSLGHRQRGQGPRSRDRLQVLLHGDQLRH